MSVILDALKKAQDERKRITVGIARGFADSPHRPRWIVYSAIAGVLVLGAAFAFVPGIYKKNSPPPASAAEKKDQLPPTKEIQAEARVPVGVAPAAGDALSRPERGTRMDFGTVVKGEGPGSPVRARERSLTSGIGDTDGAVPRSGHGRLSAVVSSRGKEASKSPAEDASGSEGRVFVRSIDEDRITTMYNKALKEGEKGNVDEARRLYLAVLAAKPENIEAMNNLGVLAMRESNTKEALFYFKKILGIKKNYGKAYNNIGLILLREGDKIQAEGYFRKSIETDRGSVEPYLNLTAVLRSDKRLSEASQLLEALLNKGERNPAVHLSYAIIKDEMGEPTDAIAHYRYYLREVGSSGGTNPVVERLKTLETNYPRKDR